MEAEDLNITDVATEKLAIILDGISDALGNIDHPELKMYLDQFEIEKTWEQEQFRTACIQMLEVARSVNNMIGAKMIIRKYESKNERQELVPLLTDLYLWDESTVEILRFMAKTYPDEKFFWHVVNLINVGDVQEILQACVRLDAVFPKQSADVYRGLAKAAEENRRVLLSKWLHAKESDTEEPAAVPEWVRPFNFDPKDLPSTLSLVIPNPPDPNYKLPDAATAATMILAYNRLYSIEPSNYDVAHTTLKNTYEIATEDQKKKMMANIFKYRYMQELEDNENYFRLLGPAHAMASFNSANINHPCLKYGGCRMFICQHHVEFEDSDEVGFPDDWFIGKCMYRKCQKIIESRVHAIREPVRSGGWFGCFCSAEHLTAFMDEENGGYQVDPNQLVEVQEIVEDLKRIGIQDRIEAGPIVPWVEEVDYRTLRPEGTPTISQLLAGTPKIPIEIIPVTLPSVSEDFAPPGGIVETPSYCNDPDLCI